MSGPGDQRIARLPEAMPFSRALRIAIGLLMVVLIGPALWSANWSGRGRVAVVFLALVVFYTAVHYVVGRYLGWLHPWAGAAIAAAPVLVVFVQGGAYEVGAVGFVGLSLIVIAALGHPGCEVLAFPALILGRRTHLACLLFSPLDWIEAKVAALIRGRAGWMKKVTTVLALLLVALLVIPVLIAQLARPGRRSFEWVELAETTYREVSFRNTAQDLQLAGMLFVPDGEGPFPAAVIIHGSGTSQRDSGWYLTLTQYLQDNGVVVLLPDKRGSERSEGNWRTASFEDLAADAVAAVSFLKDQTTVAVSHIGIIGLSQGGHIAPVVADQTDDVAFVVNVVGGAVPMHELLVYEETHNLRELGILPGLSDLLAHLSARLVIARQGQFWSAIGNFDPVPYWRKLSVPALTLYGENDTNVPSDKSAEILRSLGNPNITVRVYEGSGHALESPEGEGQSLFREDALREIRDFIRPAATPPELR